MQERSARSSLGAVLDVVGADLCLPQCGVLCGKGTHASKRASVRQATGHRAPTHKQDCQPSIHQGSSIAICRGTARPHPTRSGPARLRAGWGCPGACWRWW
jgi:hypothetical protein